MDAAAHPVELQASVPEALQEFAHDPQAHFFQSPQWLRTVAQVRDDLRPWIPCVFDADGKLLAALPLFESRRWGVRRLYGGPWGTYGGVLARDAVARHSLLRWFEARARGMALVRVHDFSGSLPEPRRAWSGRVESCQVLALPAQPQELFDTAFTSQNRNKIRKAEKNGVQVSLHADAAALETYADLYEQLTQRHRVERPLPRALFRALAGCGGVEVWLAHREGRTIAGLLNLNWGGQIMNWGNVSLPESWHHAPNNLLHWKALERACGMAEGPRLYNFGSSAVSPQVHTFKKSFGAVDRTYMRRERLALWVRLGRRLRGRSM